MGIGRMIERAGEAAGLPFPMLRHSTGYALAARGMDTRRLQHFLGHASITNNRALHRDVVGAVHGYLALISTPAFYYNSGGPKRTARWWLALPTPPTRIV